MRVYRNVAGKEGKEAVSWATVGRWSGYGERAC